MNYVHSVLLGTGSRDQGEEVGKEYSVKDQENIYKKKIFLT